MLGVTRPAPLATETVEEAAIALLEARSIDEIAGVLVRSSVARSGAARGAVLVSAAGSMAVATTYPASDTPARQTLSRRVVPASIRGTPITLVEVPSAFESIGAPVTAVIMPLRQQAEVLGALYAEFDDSRARLDPQTVGSLSLFARQAAHAIVALRTSENLEREADMRRLAEESQQEIYDSMLKHQRIGKMGDFRFNTRTLSSRGSAQCYTIFGYEEGTDVVEYDQWMDTLHPEDRQRVHDEMHEAFAKKVPLRFEYRLVVDGKVRHILSEGHPEFDRNGDLLYCGVVVDITERKAVEEVFANMRTELATALRLASLGELAGSVVHEVNQPLTAMIANADACRRWLSKTPANVEEALEAADHVSQEARRASAVVSGLQALARGARTRFARLRVQDAIAEVLLLLKNQSERMGVSTVVDLPRDMPELVGDRLQLQQVVYNIVRNACDAMKGVADRPRVLRITGWIADEVATVSFKDSGEGADPERLESMFAPLHTTKGEGLGLGLSICKRIVSAHRGQIWAERNNDDGLTVSFAIPTNLVADPRQDSPRSAERTPTGAVVR